MNIGFQPPTVALSTTSSVVNDSGGSVTLTATLSKVFRFPVVVHLSIAGTGVAGID